MFQERALEDITTTGVFLRGCREGGPWWELSWWSGLLVEGLAALGVSQGEGTVLTAPFSFLSESG